MKILKLLFLLVVLFNMEACSKKQQGDLYHSVNMVVGFIEDKINEVETFNLLDLNSRIPKLCKINSENKNAFNKLRNRVAFCATQNEFTDFAHTKICLIEIAEAFDGIKDKDCKKAVLRIESAGNAPEVMSLMLNRFYDKNITSNGEKFNWDQLSDYFSLVSVWFNQTRGSMYPLSDSEKIISANHARVFEEKINQKLWGDIQKSDEWRKTFGEVVNPTNVKNEDGSLRTTNQLNNLSKKERTEFKIFETMLSVNKKVLESLFSSELAKDYTIWGNGQMAPSPLLAGILGDAFAPFFQRILVVTKIYDIACKLKECEHSFYENNLTYWYLNFLNSIAKNESFKSFKFDQVDPKNPLPLFLRSLDQNKTIITKTLNALAFEFNQPSILAIKKNNYPKFLLSFKKAFEESSFLISNYESSRKKLNNAHKSKLMAGYFTSQGIQEVKVGFSASKMQQHIENMKYDNLKLEELIKSFNGSRNELIQQVLSINSSKKQLKDLENNITIDLKKMFEEKNKTDTLRSYIHKEKTDFYERINIIINNPNLNGKNNIFVENRLNEIKIPTSANKTGIGEDKTNIDLSHATLLNFNSPINKGDILQFNVDGRWSPTCAISEKYNKSYTNASTDSRGFSLVKTDGTSKVTETNNYRTSEGFNATNFSINSCAGAGPKFDTPFYKASIEVCAGVSTGHRKSHGTTSSNIESSSNRSEASFELGVTLDNTPFESAAAGSLLLVEMPKGELLKSKARKITILNRSNYFVLNNSSDNSDFYLIGNDCESQNNSGTLNVEIKHLRLESEVAIEFISKIASITKNFENRFAHLISSGTLDSLDIEQFKKELFTANPNSNFTPQMLSLLDSVVSFEASVLNKKSQIIQQEKSIELMSKRIQSLLDLYTAENEEIALRVENRNWNLSNMDLDFINGSNGNVYTLNRILNTMENSLVSYLDFKFRDNNKSKILGDISLLQDIQFSDPFEKIAKNVTNYNRELLDNLKIEMGYRPDIPKTSIGIRILNPFYDSNENRQELPSGIPKMERDRATIFWDKFRNWGKKDSEQDLNFEIRLSDLYTKYGLKCFVQSPIIESMGIFFIPKNAATIRDYNMTNSQTHATLELEGLSTIPFKYGPIDYNFVEEAREWRFFNVIARMAENEAEAFLIFRNQFPPNGPTESGFGTGRPIFGDFKIGVLPGFERVNDQASIGGISIDQIKEVILIYEVSAGNTLNFNNKMNWMKSCN